MIQATLYEEKKMDFLPKYCTFPCFEWALVRKLGSAFAKNKRLVFALDLQKKSLRRSPFTGLIINWHKLRTNEQILAISLFMIKAE
jgi:hypothetical protein